MSGPFKTSTPQSERIMMLHRGERGEPVRLVEAIGEDSVVVFDVNLYSAGTRTNEVVLVGPAINEAELVSFDCSERWSWRETRDGDYPEPTSGQVITPVRTKLGLK